MPDPDRFVYQTTELSPFGPVMMYGTGRPISTEELVRHVASGTVCTDPRCDLRHHRPRHRADLPTREQPTVYVGKHRRAFR